MFTRTLKFSPANTRIRTSLALGYAQDQRYKEAEYHFRRVLDFEPWNVRARIGLGKALCDLDRCWDGLLEYEKIPEAGAGGLNELLKDNIRRTRDILIDEYRHKLVREPGSAESYFRLGTVYFKSGNFIDAVGAYLNALLLDAGSKDTLFQLGAAYEKIGNFDVAVTYYERILTIKDGRADMDDLARRRLGAISEMRSDPKTAEQNLRLKEIFRSAP